MTQDDPNGRDPTVFAGTAISPGVGIGPAWLVVDLLKSAPDPAAIARDQIASEWNRVLASFEQTRRELEDSALRIEEQFDAALAGIFRAHGMMLAGIVSSGEIERELESLVGAEVAVRRVFRRLHERFLALKGPTLQQRADDVADLGRRVLRHLMGVDGSSLEHVPAGHVLVVERLLPSDVVPLSRRGVAAIVVGALASGAHAALLAREKRIPVVAGPPEIVHRIRNLEELLVDGSRGTIVVSPDAETPAAALGVATIGRHVDFLSVGTNDLAQYTLAAGRDDPAVSQYYDDTHAAVLRLLTIAINDAAGVPIALCGELAGREETMPQLLRLGFRSLSMAPGLIPRAKELIRGVRLGEPASPGSAARSMTARNLPEAAS